MPIIPIKRRFAILLIIFVTTTTAIALSQGRGRRGQERGGSSAGSTAPAGGFGKDEARIIVDWFHDSKNLSGLPPGLAKREQLPPGLQRQLIRNGSLPPGLEKKIQPLPPVLEARLPPLPDDRRRVIIGGNVILINKTTSLIIDILVGVF